MTCFTMELLTDAHAGKKKVQDVSPFIHLPLLLHPVSVTLYALCIKKPKTSHTSRVKIKKEVIKKPALIYTSVCVKANQ